MHVLTLTLFTILATASDARDMVAEIQRTFPSTQGYRCHCPSVILKCTFPRNPVTAVWYVSVNGNLENCDDYSSHSVNNASMQLGSLDLLINNTGVSQGNIYSCTAVYANGSTAESEAIILPTFEDVNAGFFGLNATTTQHSMDIEWDHPYIFCRSCTVLLDGVPVSNCQNLEPETRSCHIENLRSNTTYRVTVIAKEVGLEDSIISKSLTTRDPFLSASLPTEFCFTTLVICFVVPHVLCWL